MKIISGELMLRIKYFLVSLEIQFEKAFHLMVLYENYLICIFMNINKINRKAMNRNWSNQKANPALKTKTGNKYILHVDKIQ